jgi:hypothetical protein
MNPVAAWLESTEGQDWARTRMTRPRQGHQSQVPGFAPFAQILADPGLDASPYGVFTPDPAHDPCGRPVLRELR